MNQPTDKALLRQNQVLQQALKDARVRIGTAEHDRDLARKSAADAWQFAKGLLKTRPHR